MKLWKDEIITVLGISNETHMFLVFINYIVHDLVTASLLMNVFRSCFQINLDDIFLGSLGREHDKHVIASSPFYGFKRPGSWIIFHESLLHPQMTLKTHYKNIFINYIVIKTRKLEHVRFIWGFNIKKVTDSASLTVWNRQKRRGTAKNGKTVNKTRPDGLCLKWDFQNCLWNFSTLKWQSN